MSYIDRMKLAFGEEDNTPVSDQEKIIEEFHAGTGRVAVDAAAGTGKTTTMLYTAAETAVREASDSHNPFSEILLTSFNRDAASELKNNLKQELQRHEEAGGDLPSDAYRWIETDSHIQTMDSFFHELLTEVSLDVGLPPDFEIDEGIELQQLKDDIFADLRRHCSDEFELLEEAYPAEEWREYPPDTVDEMITTAQQKCRELGVTPVEAEQQMVENLNDGHGGQTPPQTLSDIEELLQTVVEPGASVTVPSDAGRDENRIYDEMVTHAKETYERSLKLIEAFGTVIKEYEEQYDDAIRQEGVLTFNDATHILREFLNKSQGEPFADSLSNRLKYIFIDEFQDTSIAQCEILRKLISGEETQLLLIGDVKQSIYEWRSADPSIFSEIIEETRTASGGADIPYLNASDVAYHPLTSNFRSHEQIVSAANHIFSDIFDDPTRGDISDNVDIDYVPVEAASPVAGAKQDDSHVHVLDLELESPNYNREDYWQPTERRRVAETIAEFTNYSKNSDADPPITVTEGLDDNDDPVTRPPRPGDITLLFRSGVAMEDYAEELSRYGVNAAPKVEGALFEEPEIKLLIDVLYWFANPHHTGSILRILRSPLVACSDETLRALAAREYYLEELTSDWPTELPDRDQEQIESLINLRDDLRWDREGSKTDLVNRILRHSSFDAVVLADEDGLRNYGNIWRFTEIIHDWEEEELLPYRDFVDRLVTLREQTDSGDNLFNVIETADRNDETTVTMTTVHASKGKEYPIVFLCDLAKNSNWPQEQSNRLVSNRQRGFALRPKAADSPFPSEVLFPTPNLDEMNDDYNGDDVWIGEDRDIDFAPLTGPIWLSNDRDDNGRLAFDNPLNQYVKSKQAEFWRMFYVAFTRAEDHIFLGTTEIAHWYGVTDYVSWADAINNLLMPDDGWSSGNPTISINGGPRDPPTLDIGVNDIPAGSPVTRESIAAPDLRTQLQSQPAPSRREVPFLPARLSASRIHELMECQRRYQYQHVQEIAPAREQISSLDPLRIESAGNETPAGLNPDRWGTIVHKAFEQRVDGDTALDSYLDSFTDSSLSDRLEQIVDDARSNTTEFFEATNSPDEVQAEFSVATSLEIDDTSLRVEGDIDLLYQQSGDWFLVDYKTGARPESDYKKRRYRRQLQTYAWLLKQKHGIELQEASLLYVDIESDPICEVELVPEALDTAGFETELRTQLGELKVDSSNGLRAEPTEERCDVCPYAQFRGGPCEEG